MQNYIKILLSDFSKHSSYKSKEGYFRSLEKYLENNNRQFLFDDSNKSCIVYVVDKNEAMRIGLHFKLHTLEYYDGLSFSRLFPDLLSKKGGSMKSVIINTVTYKQISPKEIKKEFNHNYLTFNSIIDRKILTKTKLEKLVYLKVLKEVNIKNKRYIDREELFNFLSQK